MDTFIDMAHSASDPSPMRGSENRRATQTATVSRIDGTPTRLATYKGKVCLIVNVASQCGLTPQYEALEALHQKYAPRGFTVRPVRFRDALHLKSAVTALPDGRLMINPAWVAPSELSARAPLLVPDTEPWGANTVTVHDTVCLPAEHPRTADLIRDAGYAVDTTPLSEFAAVEGGASCLSILIVVKGKATSRPSPVRTLPSHQDGSV